MRLQNYILMKRKREVDGKRIDYEIYYSQIDGSYYKISNTNYYNPALIGSLVAFSMTFKWLESFYLKIESLLVSFGIIGIIFPFIIASGICVYIEYRNFTKKLINKKNILNLKQVEEESISKKSIFKLYLLNWIKLIIIMFISFGFLLLILMINLNWGFRATIYMFIWAFTNWAICLIFTESLFHWLTALKVVKRNGK